MSHLGGQESLVKIVGLDPLIQQADTDFAKYFFKGGAKAHKQDQKLTGDFQRSLAPSSELKQALEPIWIFLFCDFLDLVGKKLETLGRADQTKPNDFAVRLRNLRTNRTHIQIPYGADGMSLKYLRDRE